MKRISEQLNRAPLDFSATRACFAENLALPNLAAVIERCALFIGHDSGISHIAAAVGTPCVLLFRPDRSREFGLRQTHVSELFSRRTGTMADISVDEVLAAADAADESRAAYELMRIGIST